MYNIILCYILLHYIYVVQVSIARSNLIQGKYFNLQFNKMFWFS